MLCLAILPCSSIFPTVGSSGALFVVVEGRTTDDIGLFELSVQSNPILGLSDCPYNYIHCGDQVPCHVCL